MIGGGLVAWFFFVHSSNDLKNEAAKLRKLNKLILRGLEEAELVEWNKDAEGNPTGVKVKLKGSVVEESKAAGDLTVKRKS